MSFLFDPEDLEDREDLGFDLQTAGLWLIGETEEPFDKYELEEIATKLAAVASNMKG